MTRPLILGVMAAMTLASPALAGPGHGRARGHGHAVVVVRPYRAVVVAQRYRPYYYRPYYRPYYYRPYYTFRPRFSIGFGIWAGYPVPYPVYAAPYPYSHGYPAPYAYPPPYSSAYPTQPYPSQGYPSQGYPPQGYPSQPSQSYPSYGDPRGNSVQVQPRSTSSPASGGVSLEITPSNASVFVDGRYVGSAQDFGPQMRPLTLSAGRHRVEIQAGGYDPMTFDTTVTAGEVTPYRGTLQQR
jgi:PEGA domain